MSQKRLVPDTEICKEIADLSLSWVRKDRRGARLLPFYKLGGNVLYDPVEVVEAIKSHRVGGARPQRRRSA